MSKTVSVKKNVICNMYYALQIKVMILPNEVIKSGKRKKMKDYRESTEGKYGVWRT